MCGLLGTSLARTMASIFDGMIRTPNGMFESPEAFETVIQSYERAMGIDPTILLVRPGTAYNVRRKAQ
jgi:hypothetical protein